MATIIINNDTLAGAEEGDLRAMRAAKDAEARDNWYDDEWRAAEAAVMAEEIYYGFETENLLDMMAEVETVNEGDRITVDEISGLQVFYVATGGQIDESSLTEKTWTMTQDYVGYHVVELVEKLRSGFSRRQGVIVDLAIKQMVAAFNRRLWGLFQQAIPGLASPYYVEGNGVSLPALITCITEVQDEAQTENVAIIGRRTMTNQIIAELMDQNGFLLQTNEEMVRRGHLGTYFGADIIALTNYKDSRRRAYIPGNELIVTAPRAAKVGFWGGMYGEEYNEQGGFYWHNFARRTVGMAMRRPEYARRIVDTGRSAA